MRIAAFCSHIGNEGGLGGGEHLTFWFLYTLMQHYDLTAFVERQQFPRFENALADYGIDLAGLKWKYLGTEELEKYDCLVNISHYRKLANPCRLGAILTFFPQWPWDTRDYDTIITISEFCRWAVYERWGRNDAIVIYPPIRVEDFSPLPKQNSIVMVGRFFDVPSGNTKRHDVVIRAFQAASLDDWELHLVGTVQHPSYYAWTRQLAGDDRRIVFHHDLNGEDYRALIRRASILVSATGYQATDISACEHRGIIVEEAMAAGVVPLVHDSGGMPEGGALTWRSFEELVKRLHILCSDNAYREELSQQFQEVARQYDIGVIGPQLVEAIERPIAILPDEKRRKIWVKEEERPVKVGIISDCGDLTTGFGTVTKQVSKYMVEAGFEVAAIGMLDKRGDPRIALADPYPIWRANPYDGHGMVWLEQFLKTERPDVVYVNYDLGSVIAIMSNCRDRGYKGPFVIYVPIEGAPMPDEFPAAMLQVKREGGEVITYTRWGAELVKVATKGLLIRWAWHGADHAPFERYSAERRRALRQAVGLHDKFVVMALKRNKRTSNLDLFIYAAHKLKQWGILDTVFYLHTNPFEQNNFQPVPLMHLVQKYGVQELIWFPPIVFEQEYGVAYQASMGAFTDDQRMNFGAYSLIDRYNCADVFCAMESVEGFGLPLVEAMACGLPVVSVADGGVREEILSEKQPGDVALLIKPAAMDTWHTGARLHEVNYVDLARVIKRLREKPDVLAQMSENSLRRAQAFKWEDCGKVIVEAIRAAYGRTS